MKSKVWPSTHTLLKYGLFLCLVYSSSIAYGQIRPPGYDRELEMWKSQQIISPLERDSVTLIDTIKVFDPETYESTTEIIITNYSIKDYCRNFLAINDPDFLLDGKPHTIIDPRTYEDIVIRLNSSGKLDTIPN